MTFDSENEADKEISYIVKVMLVYLTIKTLDPKFK